MCLSNLVRSSKFKTTGWTVTAIQKKIGKIGTDIQTHKCTWLLSQALLIASPEQRKLIEVHLGKDDDEDVQKIKRLYKDLKLPELYAKQETESFERVKTLIDKAAK